MDRVSGAMQSTFASGATTEKLPNAGRATGSVAAWATIVAASTSPTDEAHRGSTVSSHSDASPAKRASPATAQAESWKPRENAHVGSNSTMPRMTVASAPRESPRRPNAFPDSADTIMNHALTAETCTPLAITYKPAAQTRANADARRPRRARAVSHPTMATNTTRCEPDTATACDKPVVRKSRSACVLARSARSPMTIPSSRAPASPFARPRVALARALNGRTIPRSPGDGTTSEHILTLMLPTIPRWRPLRRISGSDDVVNRPCTLTRDPWGGGMASSDQISDTVSRRDADETRRASHRHPRIPGTASPTTSRT